MLRVYQMAEVDDASVQKGMEAFRVRRNPAEATGARPNGSDLAPRIPENSADFATTYVMLSKRFEEEVGAGQAKSVPEAMQLTVPVQ